MSSIADSVEKIDLMLEEAGYLVVDGEFQKALPLLQEILANGDEGHQAMAEAYLLQMEEMGVSLATDVVETSVEPQPISLANNQSDVVADSAGDDLDEVVASLKEFQTSLDAQFHDGSHHGEIDEALSAAENVRGKALEVSDDFSGEANGLSLEEKVAQIPVADTEEQQELNMALEQALLLIEDSDYETAEILLEPVLGCNDSVRRDMAIAFLNQPIQHSQPASNETENDLLVIDEEQPVLHAEADTVFVDNLAVEQQSSPSDVVESTINLVDAENQVPPVSGEIGSVVTEQNSEPLSHQKHVKSPEVALTDLALPSEALMPHSADSIDYQVTNNEEESAGLVTQHRQGFHIGNIGLMMEYADGSELVDTMPELYRLPGAPAWFSGITNLHGLIIPVFDLNVFFGISGQRSSRSARKIKPMLLILSHEEKSTGVIIDGLPERLEWDQSNQSGRNAIPDFLLAYVDTVCLIDKKLWFDLDVESLCSALEQELAA